VELKEIFVWLSAIFSLGAYLPYIKEIIANGSVRPNRASWLVWWVIDAVMVWALWSAKAYHAVPMFAAFTVGTTIVLILSLRKGEGEFSRFDYLYMIIALIGIILWRVNAESNPAFSVAANMLAATMATIPTFRKSFLNPKSEDPLTWSLFFVGGFFNILSIPTPSFVNSGPTIMVWGLQAGILVCLIVGTVNQKALRRIHKVV
jgi:hypothetical protein